MISCFAGGAGSRFFTARKHEPTAPDRREDQRHANRIAEHGRAQIAHRRRDRTARPQCHGFERPAVCAQRRFVLSAAVDVIEHHTREPTFRHAPQVFDVQNARRLNRSRQAIHELSRSRCINEIFINTGLQPGAISQHEENRFNGFTR